MNDDDDRGNDGFNKQSAQFAPSLPHYTVVSMFVFLRPYWPPHSPPPFHTVH